MSIMQNCQDMIFVRTQHNKLSMLDQGAMMNQEAHALEITQSLRASQWLSHIMKPSRGQSISANQLLKSSITVPFAQKLEPPAEVDASSPISNFSPAIPLQPQMGAPWAARFLQLRYTSCRQPTEPPAKLSYPLLQAWGWQKSINGSARLTIGTKQFQGCPALSGVGTYPTVCITATSSGETMMSLFGPMAYRSNQIVVATVRGVAWQLSMSRSIPSRPQLTRAPAREEIKLLILVLVAKTKPQFPFCPPTEISTLLPLLCHQFTRVWGKLASSTITLPSTCVLTKARITNLTLGLTSSVFDWPQQSPPKPQQKMETGREVVQTRTASKRMKECLINITPQQNEALFYHSSSYCSGRKSSKLKHISYFPSGIIE